MSHDWKFGDWGRSADGSIIRFVSNGLGVNVFVSRGGQVSSLHGNVEYLPDCTWFDWQPHKSIEPPPGYRLVTEGNITEGDICLLSTRPSAPWCPSARIGKDIKESLELKLAFAYARKIEPQYRPFANAAEFRQHRLRWWRYKDETVTRPPGAYGDTTNWVLRFDNREFEDGTPFGIATEKEATCAK